MTRTRLLRRVFALVVIALVAAALVWIGYWHGSKIGEDWARVAALVCLVVASSMTIVLLTITKK